MKRILVIGGGFAGLWSAVAAARRLQETGAQAEVTLVNRDNYHSIRVRNYEDDLTPTLVPLPQVLYPVGVRLVIGEVTAIDTAARQVELREGDGVRRLPYDRLVMAAGSRLELPPIQGLAEHAFDIDTHGAALRLQRHLTALADGPRRPGRWTALVVGSGATGVELAAELPARLRALAAARGVDAPGQVRVLLADRGAIAGGLGDAGAVIERACRELGVDLLPNVELGAVDADGANLSDGSRIAAATVVWCGGMRATGLNGFISPRLDPQGRLYADDCLRVEGVPGVFAAGDAARMLIDGSAPSVMSCQHARPMGRYAGHNAVNDLLGQPLAPLSIDWYTNIIDLGPWGAVYSEGWERRVRAAGDIAKQTKNVINRQRIYPPLDGNRDHILAASTLELQRPPAMNGRA